MFNYDEEEEENFLDDILRKAHEEEIEEAEKEKVKLLLHRNANLFFDEISKDEEILLRDVSIEEEGKKTLLRNMLNLFVEFEEYEKCAKVHKWQEMIENKNAKYSTRKSRRV
jgi:hypothetical protein